MGVRFGIISLPPAVAEAVSDAKLAEDCGFDWVGVVDSQSVYRELYVTLAACASATSRLRLGPAVTNPITRHPAVAASAMASVDDIAPGRTFFGMSSGDSAILNLAERPARLAEMSDYLRAMRELLTSGKTEYQGKRVSVSWPGVRVRLHLAAEGPKTLELAGEVADGVIINPGLQPELVRDAVERIHAGANRAGRDPADIDISIMVRVNICDDPENGIEAIAMELASNAHHVFRFTHAGKQLPDHLVEAVDRVQRGYRPAEHEQIGGANARIMDGEPELLSYLAERFAVVGSPEACAGKLRQVVESGVDNFLFTGFVQDRPTLIRTLGNEVLPLLS